MRGGTEDDDRPDRCKQHSDRGHSNAEDSARKTPVSRCDAGSIRLSFAMHAKIWERRFATPPPTVYHLVTDSVRLKSKEPRTMQLSDQRLDELLNELQQGKDASAAIRDEWASIAAELRQLRLRTSARSRSADVSKFAH